MERTFVIGYVQAGSSRIIAALDTSGYPWNFKSEPGATKKARELAGAGKLVYIVYEAIVAFGPRTTPVVEIPISDAK